MNEDKNSKKKLPGLSRADIHIHTSVEDGKPSPREIVEYVQKNTDLAVIAITDHDTIEGALRAKKIAEQRKFKFEVVIGEEISTTEGHVIGLFLKKKIEPGQTAEETIREIHGQGGLAIAAHPMYQSRFKSPKQKYSPIDGVGAINLIKLDFDGIEILNGNIGTKEDNLKAKYVNRALLFKSEIGGSDAHVLEGIGMAYTLFEGKTAEDLRNNIKKATTQAFYRHWRFNLRGLLQMGLFWWFRGAKNLARIVRYGFSPMEPPIISKPKDFK